VKLLTIYILYKNAVKNDWLKTLNINFKLSMKPLNKKLSHIVLSCCIAYTLSGCTAPTAISESAKTIILPDKWQSSSTFVELPEIAAQEMKQTSNWLANFNDPVLNSLVANALKNNHGIQSNLMSLKIAKERVTVSQATDFPELTLNLNNSRRKLVNGQVTSFQTTADVSLQLSYEIDIWGKLSDEQRKTSLLLAAAALNFQQAQLSLVAKVSSAWFELIEAKQLLNLYKNRAENLSSNLATIQSSYRLGLSDALDVYLTQNNVSGELARVNAQKLIVITKTRVLELLLGQYPTGLLESSMSLPLLDHNVELGLPTQLLTRRPDLSAAWYNLLAVDAELAIAHKARFPRFSLSSSLSDNSNELSDLLSGNTLAWSLLGNVTSPLFNSGKLASMEEQARLSVVKQEHDYLTLVYQSFAQVQNNIDSGKALIQRNMHIKSAEQNALIAEKLAFNQYLRGLVSYTTVLEAQRRAFDAQTNVIQLTNLLLQNRIDLYLSLGGSATENNDNTNSQKAVE